MKMTFGFGLLSTWVTWRRGGRKNTDAVTATRCDEWRRTAAGWQRYIPGEASQCRSHAAADLIDCRPRDKWLHQFETRWTTSKRTFHPKLKLRPFPAQSRVDGGSPERLADTPGTQSGVRVASRPDVRVFELRLRKPELWWRNPCSHRHSTQRSSFLQFVEIRDEPFIVACGCKASVYHPRWTGYMDWVSFIK